MALDLTQTWPEIASGFILIAGLAVSLLSPSPAVSYVIVLVAGLLFGKLWQSRQQRAGSVGFVMTAVFLLGFLLGMVQGDQRIAVILYVLAVSTGYWVSKNVLGEFGF